jgi:hypothetical protein
MSQLVFAFNDTVKLATAWVEESDDSPDSQYIECRACGDEWPAHVPGAKPRIKLVVTRPGSVDDILAISSAFSRRAIAALRASKITGCKFVPLLGVDCERDTAQFKATAEHIRKADHHQAIWIIGRGGSLQATHRLRVLSRCDSCSHVRMTRPRGSSPFYKIDAKQWDGSDMFHVEGTGRILMTQRAVDCLVASGASNCAVRVAGMIASSQSAYRRPPLAFTRSVTNIYLLASLYGTWDERRSGLYRDFWTEFFAGRLGDRSFRNAMRQVKKFRPKGERTIRGMRWAD